MLGLTQKEIAEKLGMTRESYINKEQGRSSFKDEEKRVFKNLLIPLFPNITIENIFF